MIHWQECHENKQNANTRLNNSYNEKKKKKKRKYTTIIKEGQMQLNIWENQNEDMNPNNSRNEKVHYCI